MKYFLLPLIWMSITVCWLIGGQFFLQARRFGIPVLTVAYAYWMGKGKKAVALLFLAFIGILSLGYGENSWIRKACGGSETVTRLIMSGLIASVFAAYLDITHQALWKIPLTYGVNLLAWQIRAGSLGKIGKYDILIEDICRATAMSVSTLAIC